MVQFDWGTKKMKINGQNKTVCFAVFAFPYSNYRYVYVTEKMNGHSFIEAFHAFTNHVGGVYPILLIDNMRIAASFKKKLPTLTALFQQLQVHFKLEVRLCTPYRPNQKGTVENAVKTLKRSLTLAEQEFSSLQDLQDTVSNTFMKLNQKMHHEKNDTIDRLLLHENFGKSSIPKKHFIYTQEEQRKVRNNTLISFDGNYYSAPEEYKGETITVRYTDRTIRLLSKNGRVLAKYSRCYGKKQKKYRVWNILGKLQRKSNGFDQSKEKRQMPTWLKSLYEKVFQNQANDFLIFLEILQHMKKNVVKRMLKWHEAYHIQLTNESAFEFLSRS